MRLLNHRQIFKSNALLSFMYANIKLLLKLYVYILKKYLYTSYFRIGDMLMMKFDDKKFIAEKIKYHRKKMNLTQAELAEMTDISDQHLSRIERGCYIPSLNTFFMLVKILKIDLREFGFDTEDINNPLKSRLVDVINKANDNELVFFNDVITSLDGAIKKVQKNFRNEFFM